MLKLPLLGRAVLIGVAAAAAGTIPWAALVSANTRHQSTLLWAVPLMAVYLWLYWRYLVRGTGWPRSTTEPRRMNARANALPSAAWGPALLAGLLGLGSVLLLQGVLSRLVALPQQQDLDVSRYPVVTVLMWVMMSAVVAGIVEETSFRGYLQRPIERRHRPVFTILVTGSLFGFAHFAHPEVGVVLLPFYFAVAAVYGALAYFTDSTLPGMVLLRAATHSVPSTCLRGVNPSGNRRPKPGRSFGKRVPIWRSGQCGGSLDRRRFDGVWACSTLSRAMRKARASSAA